MQLEIIISAGSHVYDLYMSIFLSTFAAKEPERIMKKSERCCNSRSPPSSHDGTRDSNGILEGQAGRAPSHKVVWSNRCVTKRGRLAPGLRAFSTRYLVQHSYRLVMPTCRQYVADCTSQTVRRRQYVADSTSQYSNMPLYSDTYLPDV